MKKRLISAALFIGLLATSESAFGQPSSTETRNVGDFTKVTFGIAGELIINIGPEYALSLEGRRSVLGEVETRVSDGRLMIRKSSSGFTFNNERITVRITMPLMEALSLSGSGKALVADRLVSDKLNLVVSGSGKLVVSELEVDELACVISGSGDIIADQGGSVDEGKIVISGSGSLSGEHVMIDHLNVAVSGSGSCCCQVSDSLDAVVSGSGNVTYNGNPRINARVSGSGRVRAR